MGGLLVQALVLETVLRDPVCDDYPPHKTYTYRFLKSYVSGEVALDCSTRKTSNCQAHLVVVV